MSKLFGHKTSCPVFSDSTSAVCNCAPTLFESTGKCYHFNDPATCMECRSVYIPLNAVIGEPRVITGSDTRGGGFNQGQAVIAERAKIRGDFREQARVSQELKEVMRNAAGKRLSPEQKEALEHIQEKIARILTGDPNEADAWLDLIGYPTLVHNILTKGTPT